MLLQIAKKEKEERGIGVIMVVGGAADILWTRLPMMRLEARRRPKRGADDNTRGSI
jgi:hypothetical protein